MTHIEVTFLGTTAGIPTKHRSHAAIYVTYKSMTESSVLWDCGEGTQRQIFSSGLNFMRLDNIFITHWHADHFAGLLGILETMGLEKRKKKLVVYGPEAEKFFNTLVELGYSTKSFPVEARNVEYEGNEIETLLETDEYSIVSIPVKHGIPAVAYALVEKDRIRIDKKKAKALGLPDKGPIFKKLKSGGTAEFRGKIIKLEDVSFTEKGKKVVYSGDTVPCANIIKLAKDADLLIHDSTYFEDMERRHATMDDVVKIAEKANVKKVVLTHISRRYQNIQELKDKIKDYHNFDIAKDFMTVVVE